MIAEAAVMAPGNPAISSTADQAAGGARERKAKSCGLPIISEATKNRSSGCDRIGSSNCGGVGANALEARKIETQIAQ